MKRSFNPWLLVMVIILGFFIFQNLSNAGPGRNIAYSEFLRLVDEGAVASVTIQGRNIQGELRAETQVQVDGAPEAVRSFRTVSADSGMPDTTLIPLLRDNNVSFENRPPSPWGSIAIALFPVLLLLGFFWFVFMRAQGGPNQVMQFGQSKAKTYGRENKVKTSFEDVAGHEEAKQELIEIVDFLKNPQKYLRIGAAIPKGVLLVGPPGTGKTLLARAVAGEAGVPFLTVSASEFMEMFVGVGASRVRNLFEEARKSAPSIIFIDELDSIGRRRGAGIGGGHDEREQTLNQILSEMDGFEKETSVIIIAATNRPDVLDPALLRPGRFDRQVTIGLPTQKERVHILKVHTRNKPVADNVDMERLASATPMFSGADLENLCNEAALVAARSGKQIISWLDFNEALDRIILGLRRGSLVPSPEERRITAYHEAGHAVSYVAQPDLGRARKVTIMPRGGAGGFMAPLSKERMYYEKDLFKQQLLVAFAGRIAEKKLTGTVSSGAASDLKQATDIAKQMVFDFGMGAEEFIAWGSDSGPVFLGGEISRRKDFSETTARQLEEEVNAILREAYERTEHLVEENWVAVTSVAEALLVQETLDGSLIERAYAMAQEGRSAEDITETILKEAKAAEEAIEEASQRAAEEAEVRRRKTIDSERKLKPKIVEPRPAHKGSSG